VNGDFTPTPAVESAPEPSQMCWSWEHALELVFYGQVVGPDG